MIRRISGWFLLLAVSAAGVAAQNGESPSLPPLLPEAREVELAKSAGLPAWTDQAAIYVLKRGGYVKVQEGTNGFSCLVGRDRADTLEPQCLDPEGTETILPRLLRESQLREQGETREEIQRDSAARFRSGEYRAPRRAGINYMLSKENRVFDGSKVIWFPPHLMFYAPYVKSAEIGPAPQHLPHSPMLLYEGDPHAYIIVVVPDSMPRQAAAAEHQH